MLSEVLYVASMYVRLTKEGKGIVFWARLVNPERLAQVHHGQDAAS